MPTLPKFPSQINKIYQKERLIFILILKTYSFKNMLQSMYVSSACSQRNANINIYANMYKIKCRLKIHPPETHVQIRNKIFFTVYP